jgi:hypothetical protein
MLLRVITLSPVSKRAMAVATTLITVALLFTGTILYVEGYVGWAQSAWVLASGTAGAAVVLWLENI